MESVQSEINTCLRALRSNVAITAKGAIKAPADEQGSSERNKG